MNSSGQLLAPAVLPCGSAADTLHWFVRRRIGKYTYSSTHSWQLQWFVVGKQKYPFFARDVFGFCQYYSTHRLKRAIRNNTDLNQLKITDVIRKVGSNDSDSVLHCRSNCILH
jgi:hypothetical protein